MEAGTATPAAHAAHGASASETLRGAGPWTATSSGGSRVTISVAEAPLKAGPVDLTVSVHAMAEGAAAHSIDLVSPSMPMHGVVRYGVEDGSARFEIPMEGLWALYVNLDAGADAAEFLFDVLPGAEGGHQHGTSPTSASEHQHETEAPEPASATHRHQGGLDHGTE